MPLKAPELMPNAIPIPLTDANRLFPTCIAFTLQSPNLMHFILLSVVFSLKNIWTKVYDHAPMVTTVVVRTLS